MDRTVSLHSGLSMQRYEASVLCVYNTLTGLRRYARLVPCMINRGSCVMDRAW